MTAYNVLLSKTALKQLRSLDKTTQKRLKTALLNLKADPFKPRSGADIRKLTGSEKPTLYRLRIGDYRAIYAVTKHEVRVTEIIHRSRGYSFLD